MPKFYTYTEKPPTTAIRLSDGGIVLGLEPLDGISGLDSVRGANGGLGTASFGNAGTWAGPGNKLSVFLIPSPVRILDVNIHDAVEVHSVDTNSWVVLDSEIDVLGDTETEVTGLGEVALSQLELLDTETTLQDFLSLWTTDGDVDSNLLVTTDTEGTDGVAGLAYFLLVSPCFPKFLRFLSIHPPTSLTTPICRFCRISFLLSLQISRFGNWALTEDWGLTGELLQHLSGTGESVTGLADTDVEDEFVDPQLTHWVARLRVGLLRESISRSFVNISSCNLAHHFVVFRVVEEGGFRVCRWVDCRFVVRSAMLQHQAEIRQV
jgi:hypothetical protein